MKLWMPCYTEGSFVLSFIPFQLLLRSFFFFFFLLFSPLPKPMSLRIVSFHFGLLWPKDKQLSFLLIVVTWLLGQDVNCLGLNSSFEGQGASSQNAVTRKAGGRRDAEKEMQVRD